MPADVDETRAVGEWHEQRKREVTIACLPRRRYRRCYEPGCSTGELTKLLAARCDHVLAVDSLPDQLPDQSFDLIVRRDLLHGFSTTKVVPGLVAELLELLVPGGDIR